MASAVVSIALPVAFAGAMTIVDATQTHAATDQGRKRLAASAVVSAPGPGLDASILTAIQARPGVRGAVGLIPTTVYVPYDAAGYDASAEAITAGPLDTLLHIGITASNLTHTHHEDPRPPPGRLRQGPV
jgi:hypothetical protein